MITSAQTEKSVFSNFNPSSKIWIYSADRFIEDSESEAILQKINAFTKIWTAHDVALKAAGTILYKRFIALSVDESQTTASGCSIDKSVHFIQDLEKEFNLNLFDRLRVYYKFEDEMKSFHFSDISNLVSNGTINSDTEIYDTTITQLEEFQNNFSKKAANSWLSKFMN